MAGPALFGMILLIFGSAIMLARSTRASIDDILEMQASDDAWP
ncbi:MAG: hypothetical protein ACKOXK_06460 [Chakrabartia sp.]